MKSNRRKLGKYESRPTGAARKRSIRSVLALCLMVVLAVTATIGGTLAYMQQQTGTVTNTFRAGEITYKLNLEANAKLVNHNNDEVTMPGNLVAEQTDTDLSANFTYDNHPTMDGYTFDGWYYDEACTEKYDDFTDKTITVNYGDTHDSNTAPNKVEITLYAKWEPIEYEVTYNGNGATAGSMDNSHHVYDVAQNLTENAYTRTGFKFLGWSEDKNATTPDYTDQQSVVNLTSTNGAVINLYAIWEQMDFKLYFDANGGVDPTPESKTVTFGLAYGDLATTSRTGYIFGGWFTEREAGTEVTEQTIVNTASDHTLYAHWTPITYTVKYDNNVDPADTTVTQPTGITADSIHTYDVAKDLTPNGYERTGYTFIGWNTQPDGKGTTYADREVVMNLTAVDGDTITLYAQWGAKSYVLRYHANGGEGTMKDQIIKYDEPTVLSKNLFTKDDHSFMGWALTPDGEEKYIDEQIVVNLLESGTLDLYAVWAQDSHTVHFDYNGGSGSPASKQFQYGKAYGQLPEYPVHPTKVVSDTEVMSYLFTGWYTSPTGGTRVYPSDIANLKEDHTLYAHWKEAPTNNVIKDIVVKNNPDDDKDGVVDDVYLNLKCSSSFEKFNIPLENLIAGQTYKITYNASNDASFGDYITGYKNSVYGSYVVATKELTGGRIDTSGELGKDYFGIDLLATWYDRIEPDGSNHDGSQAAINDSYLQGPWKNRSITFKATQATMYWVWDFGLMQDGILDNYNITDIILEPVEPVINFANKAVVKGGTSVAQIASQTNDTYSSTFVFDGDGGCETVYYPITGLNAGSTYTITFDHEFSGPLIHDTKNNSNPSYEYGCGIMNVVPTKTGDKMTSLGTWASNDTFVKKTVDGKVDSVTLTFKATSDTAYWTWNMANCSDTNNTTTKIKVTKFSASHTGGNITYHNAASNAGKAISLAMAAHDELEFTFDIDVEALGAFANDVPTAGNDFIMEFFPAEGYEMPETVLVRIDGVDHIFTLDDLYAGDDDQGNALYMLWIPGDMLENAGSLYIEAKAVEITEPETEPSTEATDPSTEPSTETTDPSTEPSTEATDPSTEPSTEATDPSTEPSTEATDPSTEPSTEATDPSTEPSTEATDPSTEPSTEATDPTGDSTGSDQGTEKTGTFLGNLMGKLLGGDNVSDSTDPTGTTETVTVETTSVTTETTVTETTTATDPTEKEAE